MKVLLNKQNAHGAKMVIRAITKRVANQILDVLQKEGEKTVTELYTQIGVEQSVCSQQLALLRVAGVVSTRRNGKYIYYSVNSANIEKINLLTEALANVRSN